MVKRSIDVIPTGAQRFEQRFPGKRRRLDDDLPQVSSWRNCLTALSETNLYFVAYGAQIYVYEPIFPTQDLLEPVLIIPSRPSAPNLPGHIDRRNPNSINNLVVSHLGIEEVVATVRDDGDVDLFLVRHITHAISARAAAEVDLGILADDVRPVFQRNVGCSCWGLAIHTQARVIAASSNLHRITSFKFALDVSEQDPSAPSRTYDAEESVINGEANIPCIAFCNTGDDPHARWLLTTDLNGICRTFDLHVMRYTQSFRFGRAAYVAGYDRHNAGWNIMFLDRRSFQSEDSLADALGLQQDETLPDAKDDPFIWDLSKTINSVPDNSHAFVEHPIRENKIAQRLTTMNLSSRHESIVQPRGPIEANTQVEMLDESVITESSASNDDEVSQSSLDLDVLDDLDDFDDEGTEDTVPQTAFYGGERICGNNPRFATMRPLCDRLPCPVLHASVHNVYLLQPTLDSSQQPHQPPFVGLARPLKQHIQADFYAMKMFERLNMSAYMPELGVVVLASQKGRAIVLALTKLRRTVKYPQSMDCLGSQTNYAMRAEAILPTARQEKENLRPFAPLYGIAAAPMQGDGRRKRWRLMLMYSDHTVLSYEIARKDEQAVDKLTQVIV